MFIVVKDYYQALGVKRESTAPEIKKAYRDLAIQLHPDRNDADDAHEKFVELNEAFQILSNDSRRKQYDALYEYFILQRGEQVLNQEAEAFESVRSEAVEESKVVASSNFYLFTTELLAELVGQALAEGLFEGIGGILKGTGEILGDALAHIDFDF